MMDEEASLERMLNTLRLAENTSSLLLQTYLNDTIARARAYDGNWQAPWLLNNWPDPVWKTWAGDKTRKNADGTWIGTANVNWDIGLPDGCRLMDDRYSRLLETSRKCSFLHRNGLVSRDPPSISTWRHFNDFLLASCSWLVLEKNRYHPSEYGFKLLDRSGIERLFNALAQGGWGEANFLVERCMNELHLAVFGRPIPQTLLDVAASWPESIRDTVIEWLDTNGLRAKTSGAVSRAFLAQRINSNTPTLTNCVRLNIALRQFEPLRASSGLFVPHALSTEYPDQNTKLVEHAGNQSVGVSNALKALRSLLNTYRHMPHLLPSPVGIPLPEIAAQVYQRSSAGGHTAFIPIDYGLRYLNSALRWVCLFGDALIDYYLAVMTQLAHSVACRKSEKEAWKAVIQRSMTKILANTILPVVLEQAGFEFTSLSAPLGKSKDFDRLRRTPSLHEALEIYIGAVTVVITLLKPSRDIEITSLPRNCLLRSNKGAYWLDSALGKRTKGQRRARTGGKPIPIITARAIQQVRKLNRGLTRLFGETDDFKRTRLFYLPNPKKWGSSSKMDSSALNKHLDLFCDYVGLRWTPESRQNRHQFKMCS